ncbi:hypothetical protein [Natronomonas sp. EA1]|uniref:hypothetical protein n=1 Tax=Natronomonas sp. EA1 TaxID=3421655 RepID=UPI003EB75310
MRVDRGTARDLTLLASVGVLLAAVHFLLPRPSQSALAFHHADPAPWQFLTSAYVHASDGHLAGNLLGYAIGAGVSYAFCVQQGRRRWFWTTTLAFLTALPLLVNLTSFLAFRSLGIEAISRGFSGVAAGFVGFVLVALARDVADRHGPGIGQHVGQGIFILLLAEVAVIYSGVPSPLISGLLVVGLALSFGSVGLRGLRAEWTETDRRRVAVEAGFVATTTLLLAVFVWVLFPASLVEGGETTNIIAHGGGFVWGVVIAILLSFIC